MHESDSENAENAQRGRGPARHTDLKLSWDAIQQVYEISRSGSLSKAAEVLNIDRRTLSRSLNALEAEVGQPLFLRIQNQWRLTQLGETIVQYAQRADSVLQNISRSARIEDAAIGGRVSIRMTEGLGTYWLAPRLALLQQAHPRLLLDMQTQMTTSKIQDLETDIAVQYERPTASNVIATRLGYVHLAVFCSNSYARTHGTPQNIEELKTHSLAFQQAEQLDEIVLLEILDESKVEDALSFKTDSSNLLLQLIRSGRAIGIAPTFTQILGFDLRSLPIELNYKLDVWLVYHPEAARQPAVRMTIDFLKECFNSRKFPWFREEYVPPGELLTLDGEEWRINNVNYDPLDPES